MASSTASRGDIQGAAWNSVDEKMASYKFASRTSSLHELLDSVEDRLHQHRSKVAALPGQIGAVSIVGGAVAGAELFDAADTLVKLLPKLVDSYLFDALETNPTANGWCACRRPKTP